MQLHVAMELCVAAMTEAWWYVVAFAMIVNVAMAVISCLQ